MAWAPPSAFQGTTNQTLTNSVIPHILTAIAEIGQILRTSRGPGLPAGTANSFGDAQLAVDVSAEKVMREALLRCAPHLVTASSEEDPVERAVIPTSTTGDGGDVFTAAFDPLDGSSIVGSNWAVGTIVGLWRGRTALGRVPRDGQVAAVLGVYGPRTTALIALRSEDASACCFEVGFLEGRGWTLLRESVRLASPPFGARYFAPANLRAAGQDEAYMGLVTGYINGGYTLRYSGGLVPDVVHALSKRHGVYVSPVTQGSPAKLRRLYELCPIALVVECAGGRAVDENGREVLARERRFTTF